jgi:hypothetical protein
MYYSIRFNTVYNSHMKRLIYWFKTGYWLDNMTVTQLEQNRVFYERYSNGR